MHEREVQVEEKKLIWVGRAKEELLGLPKEIRSEFGYALGLAQLGDAHPHAKPMKRQLREVIEVTENDAAGTYRVMYAVKLGENVYCLTAFQKKSKSGTETPKADIERIEARLKIAKQMYQASKLDD